MRPSASCSAASLTCSLCNTPITYFKCVLVCSQICVPLTAVSFRPFQHPQRKAHPLAISPTPPSPSPPLCVCRPALPGR